MRYSSREEHYPPAGLKKYCTTPVTTAGIIHTLTCIASPSVPQAARVVPQVHYLWGCSGPFRNINQFWGLGLLVPAVVDHDDGSSGVHSQQSFNDMSSPLHVSNASHLWAHATLFSIIGPLKSIPKYLTLADWLSRVASFSRQRDGEVRTCQELVSQLGAADHVVQVLTARECARYNGGEAAMGGGVFRRISHSSEEKSSENIPHPDCLIAPPCCSGGAQGDE